MGIFAVHSTNPINHDQIDELRQALGDGPVLITTHDNPDPDALASGKAINQLINKVWGIPTRLIYNGLVGRAENHAMLKYLTPEWKHVDAYESTARFSAVVFVDCQPGLITTLPINNRLPKIVIDHHYPITEHTKSAVYLDVRQNIGSTVTMIYQYLNAAQVPIDPVLATAMFLGIKTDSNPSPATFSKTTSDGRFSVKQAMWIIIFILIKH